MWPTLRSRRIYMIATSKTLSEQPPPVCLVVRIWWCLPRMGFLDISVRQSALAEIPAHWVCVTDSVSKSDPIRDRKLVLIVEMRPLSKLELVFDVLTHRSYYACHIFETTCGAEPMTLIGIPISEDGAANGITSALSPESGVNLLSAARVTQREAALPFPIHDLGP